MNPRATNAPCPCGSGLPGLRNLGMDCTGYVSCPACQVPPPAREYRVSYDDAAKRATAARRKLEAMRDEVEE